MTIERDIQALKKELATLREQVRSLKQASPSGGSSGFIMQNEARIFFSGTSDQAAYIYMSSGDDLTIGNFADGEQILWQVRDASSNQRAITLKVDATTIAPEITGQDGLRLVASSGDVLLNGGTGIILESLPTSDPANTGQVFRSGNDLRISTG